jgi:hypothetical protein
MAGGRRDAEGDLPGLIARHAQIAVQTLHRGEPANVDAAINYLISRAYESPERLLDARDLLGEPDAEASTVALGLAPCC